MRASSARRPLVAATLVALSTAVIADWRVGDVRLAAPRANPVALAVALVLPAVALWLAWPALRGRAARFGAVLGVGIAAGAGARVLAGAALGAPERVGEVPVGTGRVVTHVDPGPAFAPRVAWVQAERPLARGRPGVVRVRRLYTRRDAAGLRVRPRGPALAEVAADAFPGRAPATTATVPARWPGQP